MQICAKINELGMHKLELQFTPIPLQFGSQPFKGISITKIQFGYVRSACELRRFGPELRRFDGELQRFEQIDDTQALVACVGPGMPSIQQVTLYDH